MFTLSLGFVIAWWIFSDKNHNHTKSESESQTWTCSMHPQIRSNKPGECPICGMDLILQGSSNNSNPLVLQMSTDAVALANIQTTIVGELNSSTNEILLNGVLKADETKHANLVAHVPGRIEHLFISFTGEKVLEGQKIASIYSPELVSAQRELLEAKKLVDINPLLLESAKSKLKYWKIGDSVIEEILSTEKVREYFTIYAEHSGVVNAKKINVGDYVNKGEVLFVVEDLSQLWVVLDVYEKDLRHIAIGDKLSFSTTTYPNRTFESKIVFIDPSINSATRVAAVRAEINNNEQLLKPEMFVKASLQTKGTKEQKIAIPKTSVLWTGERSVVYLKQANSLIPSFEYKEVVLGEMLGTNYIIEEGLKVGDEVVTNGAFVIDASAQLNNKASMMNKLVSVKETNSQFSHEYKNTTPEEFKNQLQKVLDEYLRLKDALTRSEDINAQLHAKNIVPSLTNVDMNLLKGNAHLYWMKQVPLIKNSALLISESDDIEEQRQNFETLSIALSKAIQAFGVAETEIYVLHCPMASDGGANWLSSDSVVLNPYFGEKMLKCGSVIERIN